MDLPVVFISGEKVTAAVTTLQVQASFVTPLEHRLFEHHANRPGAAVTRLTRGKTERLRVLVQSGVDVALYHRPLVVQTRGQC